MTCYICGGRLGSGAGFRIRFKDVPFKTDWAYRTCRSCAIRIDRCIEDMRSAEFSIRSPNAA